MPPTRFSPTITRLSRATLALYLVILAIATFTPKQEKTRQAVWEANRHLKVESKALPQGIFHKVLYSDGSEVWVGNLLLLIPIVILLTVAFQSLKYWQIFLLGSCSSAFIEFIQRFVPGRVSDIRDFGTNCLGVLLATLCVAFAKKLRAKSS